MKKISLVMLLVVWGGVSYTSYSPPSNDYVSFPLVSARFLNRLDIDPQDPYGLFQEKGAAISSFDKNASSKLVLKKAADNSLDRDASYRKDIEENTARLLMSSSCVRTPDKKVTRALSPLRESSSRIGYAKVLPPIESASPSCLMTTTCTPTISDVHQIQSSPVPFGNLTGRSVLPSIVKQSPGSENSVMTVALDNDAFYVKPSSIVQFTDANKTDEELENRRRAYAEAQSLKEARETNKLAAISAAFINAGPAGDQKFNEALRFELDAYSSFARI